MAETTTAPAVLHEAHGHGVHRVTFDRPVTREEWADHLRERDWFGYHPAGYLGFPSVHGAVGTYTHRTSCD